MKLNSLFTGRIGRPEGRKFFGSQPTHDEFCHKKNPIWWLLRFFYMLLATLWALCTRNPLELVDRESVEICDRTQKWYFFVMIDFFSPELNSRQSIISQQINPNYKILSRKFCVPWMKCHMTFGINAVCIFMYRLQERQFSFSEICRHNQPFWKRLP